jgi:pimeloyl-ACP methyl ester carboxylesterase
MLWSEVRGDGSPTVVFEAGGGESSSVWAALEREVREREGVRTLVYDRAGLGRSAPTEPPYRVDDEADALRRELDRHGIAAPVVLVAHSYGGFVAALVAATDDRVAGVVLVDANIASYWNDARLEKQLATYRAQYAELERVAPDLARTIIPLMEAYPATVERLRGMEIPRDIPAIDIVAERTWVDEQEVEAWRHAHDAFVAASPQREGVFAGDSGHHVMHDRPELVLDAVSRIVARVRAAG